MIRRLLAGLALGLLFCLPAAAQDAEPAPLPLPAGRYGVRDTTGGVERTYVLDVPQSVADAPGVPAPLVIVLHGSGGTGATIAGYSGFEELGEREALIVVYPDALDGQWSDGRPGLEGSGDVDFIGRMLDALTATVAIDPARVYVVGHSSGGTMAQRLACALPERITAVGAVAAPMPIYLQAECDGSAPVPMALIMGTDDRNFPWTGIAGTFMGAFDTRDYWVEHNGCGIASAMTPLPDTDPGDGTLTIEQRFTLCSAVAEVLFLGVYGGGHGYPGHTFAGSFALGATSMDFDAAETLWAFFQRVTNE